jgi:ABC-type transporter Mla subunit MlaD
VPDVYRAVALGLRVQSVPQGITGVSYLELGFVNPAEYPVQPVPWKPDSPVVPSRPSTLAQVQDAAVHVLSSLGKLNLDKVTGDLDTLLQSVNAQVTTGDAHAAIGSARELLQTLNSQLKAADLPATAASIRELSNGQQTRQLIAQLDQTTANLAKTTAALPQLVAVSQGTVGRANEATADLQQQLAPILQNLATATENLRELTATLSRNPGAVLASPPPKDAP